ncbi:hypothetical protein DFH09DRAFT_1357322 [Mycena vulgaris]|nr:hypothetical protein DFH09DRAFT_1357322 [Mycena vulgaris]
MFFNTFIVFAAVSSSAFLNAHAHGTITGVTGANGVQAAGFGIIASTPRDGSTKKPFEQDTSVIRDKEMASGKAWPLRPHLLPVETMMLPLNLPRQSQAGLPTAGADGSVTMTLHQVNGDGAGPYTLRCLWGRRQHIPSSHGHHPSPRKQWAFTCKVEIPDPRLKATDFALVAQMPAGMACTAGPNGDACIMRCRNPAGAGPFGSCVAVASGDAATGNATAAAPAAAADAAPAAAAPATAAVPAAAADAAPAAAAPATAAVPAAAADAAPAAAAPATAAVPATAAEAAPAAEAPATAAVPAAAAEAAPAAEAPATAAVPAAAAEAAPAAAAPATGVATTDATKRGLAGLFSKLTGREAKAGAPAKRYIASRVAGKRAGYWLDNQ